MNRVYCKNCKCYKLNCFTYPIKSGFKEAIKIAKNHYEMRNKLNKNNNCKYYKRKWWKFLG